jgi:hypothetical protein
VNELAGNVDDARQDVGMMVVRSEKTELCVCLKNDFTLLRVHHDGNSDCERQKIM